MLAVITDFLIGTTITGNNSMPDYISSAANSLELYYVAFEFLTTHTQFCIPSFTPIE